MTISNSRPRSRSLRILVLEDEYLIAAEIALTLEGIGHEVVGPASTIAEASALIASGPLDFAFLDANLRGECSGPIATELIDRAVPFAVVTGYGGLKLGASDLDDAPRVKKPFSSYELAATLNAAFAA